MFDGEFVAHYSFILLFREDDSVSVLVVWMKFFGVSFFVVWMISECVDRCLYSYRFTLVGFVVDGNVIDSFLVIFGDCIVCVLW